MPVGRWRRRSAAGPLSARGVTLLNFVHFVYFAYCASKARRKYTARMTHAKKLSPSAARRRGLPATAAIVSASAGDLRAQLVSKAAVPPGKTTLKAASPPRRGTLAAARLAKARLKVKGDQWVAQEPRSSVARLADLTELTQGDYLARLLDVVRQRVKVSPADEQALRGDLVQLLTEQTVSPPAPAATAQAMAAQGVPEGDSVLTTQEAADLVGVSRPHLVARVDEGAIPLFSMAGTQRRVLRSAVLAWKARALEQQQQARRALADDLDEEMQRADALQAQRSA